MVIRVRPTHTCGLCVKELQELVHAKKSQIFDRYADTA